MKIVSFVVFLFCSISLSAQTIPPLSIPVQTPDMPSWARLMYAKPLNMISLDSAYKAYYATHEFEKNNYTRYYKRLLRNVEHYLTTDGTVRERREDEILAPTPTKNKNARIAAANWTAIGPMETYGEPDSKGLGQLLPWQTNVYAFDVSKSNPNILYCVSETGAFFKTTDKGKKWTMLRPQIYSSSEAVTISPVDPNIVYVGVNNGIYATTDGGNTWKYVWQVNGAWVMDIKISPSNPDIIYAATNKGLYVSIDRANTWTQRLSRQVCELELNPANSNEVYCLQYNDSTPKRYEFFKSTDKGVTFSKRSAGWLADALNSEAGGRMAVTPVNPNRIYAIILGENKTPYMMRSDDKGETWKISATGKTKDVFEMDNWQGFYDLSIAASHTNADHVMTGTANGYRSTDGGVTFKIFGGYGGDFPIHPDVQDMHCIGDETWVSTDGGIYYSTDFFTSTANAETRMSGINGADFWGFDAGWNEDVLVGGRYHNGNTAWHENYKQKFYRMGGAENSTGYVNPIQNRKMYFSDLGGRTISTDINERILSHPVGKFPNESYYHLEHSEMAWDPRCYNTVWIGSGNTIWRSTDDGRSYDSVFASADKGATMEHIEISRSNPNVVYVTQRSNDLGNGKIWKTTDAGKTWKELPPPAGTSGGERRVSTITLSGTDENVLWWGLASGGPNNKVFKSSDGGQTWENWTTGDIADLGITDIMHQLGTDGGVYAAGSNGRMYYRNNTMGTWAAYGNGLPFSHVTRTLKPFYRDNKLRSGSNNGVWETPLYEHSKPIAQPSVDKFVTACERDTLYFDDYSVLERANATWRWKFDGAIYVSDTTARNPKVLYKTPGIYPVTLTVSNDYGTDTKTLADFITVLPSECEVNPTPMSALDLVGERDIASIPALPALKGAKGFSVTAFVRLDSIQHSFSQLLSNWSSDVGFSFGFAFRGYAKNTNLTFYWNNVPYQLESKFNLPIGEWAHIALTVDTNKVTLYVNGEPWEYKNAKADFKNFDLSKTPWEIGGGLPGQGGNYRGKMDELKLYNRTLSQNEIRDNMHLILPASSDTSVVAYYQFNESKAARFYNRVGGLHSENGGGKLIPSTAPVAAGVSQRLSIKDGTSKFPIPGISLGVKDNTEREVVISRLMTTPYEPPFGAPKITSNYWIIHSWGTNKTMNVDSIVFSKIGQISQQDGNSPTSFILYKRPANDDRNLWSVVSYGVIADSVNQSVSFGADSNAVGQYIITNSGTSTLGVEESLLDPQSALQVIPNPTNGLATVILNSQFPATLRVLNSIGQIVFEQQVNDRSFTLDMQAYPAGNYIVQVTQGTTVTSGKIMLMK